MVRCIRYCATMGVKNQVKASHHFTLAYCPWSNGTVEVVCRELLRACRAILSEFQLPHTAWPSIMPVVQSALNNTTLDRLGNRCPLTVFTGHAQDTPFGGEVQVRSVEDIDKTQQEQLSHLLASLESMHKEVAQKSSKKRQQAVQSHNRKTKVKPVNFVEGDFVLRAIMQRERSKKPSLKWLGPYRVTQCRSDYIFLVENILTGRKQEVHGRRLKLFQNKEYEVSEELLDHLTYQAGEVFAIEEFQDIRRRQGSVEIFTKWRGFTDEESEWVSFSSLIEDVPEMVSECIEELLNTGTARQRSIASSI